MRKPKRVAIASGACLLLREGQLRSRSVCPVHIRHRCRRGLPRYERCARPLYSSRTNACAARTIVDELLLSPGRVAQALGSNAVELPDPARTDG